MRASLLGGDGDATGDNANDSGALGNGRDCCFGDDISGTVASIVPGFIGLDMTRLGFGGKAGGGPLESAGVFSFATLGLLQDKNPYLDLGLCFNISVCTCVLLESIIYRSCSAPTFLGYRD